MRSLAKHILALTVTSAFAFASTGFAETSEVPAEIPVEHPTAQELEATQTVEKTEENKTECKKTHECKCKEGECKCDKTDKDCSKKTEKAESKDETATAEAEDPVVEETVVVEQIELKAAETAPVKSAGETPATND